MAKRKPLTVWITTNWKVIKEMRIPDHLMQVKKQQLEPYLEPLTGSVSGKEYDKTVYCHLVYLTFVQSTSGEMPGWVTHKLESRFPREISITSVM